MSKKRQQKKSAFRKEKKMRRGNNIIRRLEGQEGERYIDQTRPPPKEKKGYLDGPKDILGQC